jgi:hypothetical protein
MSGVSLSQTSIIGFIKNNASYNTTTTYLSSSGNDSCSDNGAIIGVVVGGLAVILLFMAFIKLQLQWSERQWRDSKSSGMFLEQNPPLASV